MDEPVAGLVLLLAAGLLGLWGLWTLERDAAKRAALAPDAGARDAVQMGAIDRRVRSTAVGRALAVRLETAGVDRSPVSFLTGTALAAVATYLVAGLFLPGFLAFVAAGAAVFGRFAWLDRRREQRRIQFVSQLPELARLLSAGTSAGLAMTQALERASAELHDPAGPELRRAVAEMRYSSLDRALESLARRLPSRELGVLVTTLIIQERAGGNVVQALRELATTLEARQETLREVRTLMSGAVFSSYLVAGLGVATLVMLSSFGSGVLDRFTGTGLGLAILFFAGALYAIGFLLIRRTTRIEV